MNKKLVFVIVVLILAALACNLPWQNTPEPTEETAVPHSTEMEIETAAPTPTVDETEETPDVTADPSGLPLPIIYYDAPDLIALDPLDGSQLMRLPAANFGVAGNGGVTDNGVFYLNSDYDQAYRVGFDGVQQELTFLNPSGDSFAGVILSSPDGTKIAHGVVLSFTAADSDNQLKTVNIDGTGERILVAETDLDRVLRPTPIKWAADGSALYYMNVIVGIEGFGGLDLLKVDLATGSVATIFPDSGSLTSTSVSPGETYAAKAVRGDPLSIVIRDLAAGVDQTVTLPARFKEAWQMVWAPDDSALLVTLGLGNWEADEYTVARIDARTLDLEFLISDDPTLPRAVAWQMPETIWFNDRDGALWMMDAVTLATTTVVPADARVISISR